MAEMGHAPAVLHSDNAEEFISSAVMAAVRMAGTATTTTTAHNPEANGMTERINRTLMNGTRCILRAAKIPLPYWPFAVRDVAFKQSLVVHEATGYFTYNHRNGSKIKLSRMQTFGQLGYVPGLPVGAMMDEKDPLARNMGLYDLKHLVAQYQNGTDHRV